MSDMEALEVLEDLRAVFKQIIDENPEEDNETNREVVQALGIAMEHFNNK